jgi:hypothetical protein
MAKTKSAVPNPYEGLSREQALDTMRKLSADETRNHVLMGLLYNYLVDSRLLEDTEYKNALDYICSNIQEISRAALLMYGAVAREFPQTVCAQFGISRLRLLLTYKDAAKIELNTEEPGGTFVMVPDKQRQVQPKLFADCTAEDLRNALQYLRQKGITPVPPEQRALVDEYREAVVGSFPRGTPVRVQLRNHKGNAVVDFKGIPVMQVETLVEALLEQIHPARQEPKGPEAPQLPPGPKVPAAESLLS